MERIDFKLQLCEASKLLKPHALRLAKSFLHLNDMANDKLAKALLYHERWTDSAYIMAWLCSGLMAGISVIIHRLKKKDFSPMEQLSHWSTQDYLASTSAKTGNNDRGSQIVQPAMK